jgi:hypothetical protein
MRLWVGVLALAASLVAGSAASAKSLQKVVAVGAGGASLELTGLDENGLYGSPARTAPTGRFVLLYPLMEEDVPAQPGRYYPDLKVACYSWNRHVPGSCYEAKALAGTGLADLPTLTKPPALLTRLVIRGLKMPIPSNGVVAVELAFNRPTLAQPSARRPRGCTAARARWSGPQAAARPSRFWTCSTGVWSTGKLYPTGPLMF